MVFLENLFKDIEKPTCLWRTSCVRHRSRSAGDGWVPSPQRQHPKLLDRLPRALELMEGTDPGVREMTGSPVPRDSTLPPPLTWPLERV